MVYLSNYCVFRAIYSRYRLYFNKQLIDTTICSILIQIKMEVKYERNLWYALCR
jgi:hypothetical protein